jgi:hypothetical protein
MPQSRNQEIVMKKLVVVCVLGLALVASRSFAGEAEETVKAQKMVTAWLALVDAGKYGQSWDAASAFFKSAIPKAKWEAASTSARGASGPLGLLKGRKPKSAKLTRTPPGGAPPGEYVIVEFDGQFERRAGVETITAVHEKDGAWRVAGYYIK